MATTTNHIAVLLVAGLTLAGWELTIHAAEPAIQNTVQGTADLDALIGNASCTKNADCASIPVGHSLCGGPAAYRAWSRLSGQEAAIRAAAALIGIPEGARRPGLDASVCRTVPDPGAQCEKPADALVGSCRLRIAPGRFSEGLTDR
jgi:hypothetical protein